VVLKPASLTPLSAWHLVRAPHDAGIPKGVVNLVVGPAGEAAKVLLSHPAVAGITFTGSTEVGLEIARQAAGRNIRVQTEMGGKNALVVMADADLGLAAELAVAGGFGQTGQRCTATSRVIVEASVLEAFKAQLLERTKRIRVGPGLDPETTMGPVVSEDQLTKVLHAVERGKSEGAVVLWGGHRLQGDRYDRGYFVAPTILEGAAPQAFVAQEEIFGPVLTLLPAADLEEAIALVNGTRYGLSAAICTQSLAKAHAFAAGVEVGCVSVNLPTVGWDVHVPFGGFKESGSAFKEQGIPGLQFYTRLKSVAMKVG
jgi:aldehyde dehydrogenase (NAD+)